MNGKTEPDTETLKKISKAIGISLSDFWAGPDKYELKRRSKQSQLDEFGGLARERPETQISENDIKRAEIMKLLMYVNDTSVLDYIIEYVEFKFVNEEKKRAVSNPKNHESETA